MPRTMTFRLASEGLVEFKSQMDGLGEQGAAALKKIIDAAPGLGRALDNAMKSGEASRKRLEAEAKAGFQSLQASLDPLVASQQRLARGQETIALAVERGKIGQQDAVRVSRLLQEQFDRNTRSATGFATGMTGLTRVMGSFGVALSVGALINWGRGVEVNTAALVDQAKQLDQTTDSLQAYRDAFRQGGSSPDQADKMLARVNQELGAAIDNVGEARRQLAEWNIDWRELAAAAPEQRLVLIAKGLLAIEDSGRLARAEQDLFGKSGREVQTVLEDLSGGIDKLVNKSKAMGTLKSAEAAREAKLAADQMSDAFAELETKAAGPVVMLTNSLIGLLDIGEKLANLDWSKALPTEVRVLAMMSQQGLKPNGGPPPGGLQVPADALGADGTFKFRHYATDPSASQTNYASTLAAMRETAALAGASAEKQAAFAAGIQLANAKLKDGLQDHQLAAQYVGREASSQADILKILSPAEQAEARRLGLLKTQGEGVQRIKETFAQFLAQEQEAARIAGQTVAQRNSDLAVIKAAQIEQKANNVEARNLVQTYAQAAAYLKQQKTGAVELAEAEKNRAEIGRDILGPLREEFSLAGKTREERERELEIWRLKQQYGEKAVALSEDELRNLLRQRDIQAGDDIIADMKERLKLASMTADEAEREAAVLDAIHATNDGLLDDQKAQIRGLVSARQEAERWSNVVEGVRGDWEQFFFDLPTKGGDAFGDLFDNISAQFRHMLAYMASQAIMQPIIVPMVQQFAGSFGMSGTGAIGGGSPFGMLGGIGNTTSMFGGGGLFGGGGFSLSGIGSYGAGSMNALFGGGVGEALGGGDFIGTAGSGMTSFLGGLGPILGGAGLGSMAGSLVFGNKNDASMGSMGGALAGAAIGSIIPGVGTIIGGLIGGLAGGGLGSMTGSSNQGAIANFTGNGTGSYLFKQGGGNNGEMATQAANQVSAIISALQNSGVTVGMGNITGLSIGSDKSYIYDSAGGKQKLGGGDVAGVVSGILARILPSAAGGTPEAQSVLAHYQQGGGITKDNLDQLVSDLGFAKTLQDLDFSTKQLTQSEQALKQINDQYQQLIDKAQQLGLETDKIETARRSAIQSLIDSFDDAVGTAIQQIQDPMAAAAAALSAQQEQRIKEATALGADLTQVYALNALETRQLTDAQQAQAQQQAAQAAAAEKQTADFNTQMRIGVLGFTDALQAALEAEDVAGRQRLAQAVQLGADLTQVEHYNALNRQKVMDDFAGQARSAADSARQSLASLVSSLSYGNDSGATAEQTYFAASANYNAAAVAAQNNRNDPVALANFQQAASTFAPIAREFLGTSERYGQVRDNILSTAINLGGNDADPSGVARALLQVTAAGNGAVVDAIGVTNSQLSGLNENISRLAAFMQTAIARAAS